MWNGKRVLIAGATGYLGRYVVEAFHTAGYRVRALTRNASRLNDISHAIDEIVEAEVTDKQSLAGVCDNIDIVFSSVGITRQKDGLSYMQVDFQANLNLLHEAKRAGVELFAYVHVLGDDQMTHLKSIAAKSAFVDALTRSGMDYRVVRPTGFFSDMAEFLEMARKGPVWLIGRGDKKINPIHGSDLAEFCVTACEGEANFINVGGPDILTYNHIAQLAFEALGQTPKIRYVPLPLVRALVWLMRRITPISLYGPIEFFATVMALDIVGPQYGEHHLRSFFADRIH